MKTMLRLLFLASLMLPLAACGGGESDDNTTIDNAVEQAEEATKTAGEKAAEVVCCGGSCDAPAGFCHAEDGTCGGNHPKLPVAP